MLERALLTKADRATEPGRRDAFAEAALDVQVVRLFLTDKLPRRH